MKLFSAMKSSAMAAGILLLASTAVVAGGATAQADVPEAPVDAPFQAALCAGTTDEDPTQNHPSLAVSNPAEVFGERLDSYNEGRIVPLYDAFGSTVLALSDGTVRDSDNAAYPPLCGTRYVASATDAPQNSVSEWMFCTDKEAPSCGDTNGDGQLIDKYGSLVDPMEHLSTNPKLSSDQEKLIAYLIQNGHGYLGIGDQDWGASKAQSDLGSAERLALQTLVWCISDPSTEDSDFAATCAENMPDSEQQRILALIPDAPELTLNLDSVGNALKVGEIAKFSLSTNIYNQRIALETGGTASPVWEVCSGDAILGDGALTVNGTDPTATSEVVLCATGTAVGTVTISASATPPSTEHIGWSQGQNTNPDMACQVYATFHADRQAGLFAAADATFAQATPAKVIAPKKPVAVHTGQLAA